MKVSELRSHFPALDTKVYGKPLVYLDNAASSQRPVEVIEMWKKMVETSNANIHRAVHRLSADATEAYESARDRVRRFINAPSRDEIIFTSGATAAINLVAFSFGETFVNQGDEIIVSIAEHHSNIVPWQLLCERKGATLKAVEPESIEAEIGNRTKIVAITHISNVLGIVNPIKEIIKSCHAKGVPVLVDGAQGIVHQKVDVQELDCDFYVFSGHKVYAATGTGVLYGKKRWLDAMPPYMSGGEMIDHVKLTGTSFAPVPHKFEAGTQNFNSVPTLIPALDLAEEMFKDSEIAAEQKAIMDIILSKLTEDERITLYGRVPGEKVPVFSFAVKGAHHEDLALILDKMGIAVRSGQMCAEPLMDHLGVTGLLRASFAPYNTAAEADYFVKCLDRAISMLV